MVETNPYIQNENFEIATTERFMTSTQKYLASFIREQDQVFPSTTEINYNNPLAGVREQDYQKERDFRLAKIYEKLTGNENNQSVGVQQMLAHLYPQGVSRLSSVATIDQILSSFGDWHTFIQEVDQLDKNIGINPQTLEEGMDEKVRVIVQIDQRFADLYLRYKLTNTVDTTIYCQFILKDGSRSQCDQSLLTFWRDQMIPDGTEISTVQMMINEPNGLLKGLRFLEKNGAPILTCGRMVEDPNCLDTQNHIIREFNLQEDQRIVGYKSVSDQTRRAQHKDFQFVLVTPITKTVLLKLLANKQQVSCTGRALGKLPEGVFREVIRFVRY